MPKQKSHSGASKRFRVTGGRKKTLRRGKQMKGHLMEKKSSTRARRVSGDTDVAKADVKTIKRLISA